MNIEIILILAIMLSAISIYLSKRALQTAYDEIKPMLKLNFILIIMLCAGLITHMSGDYLEQYYGDEIEEAMESIAHSIILAAFILFNYLSMTAKKIAEPYLYRKND